MIQIVIGQTKSAMNQTKIVPTMIVYNQTRKETVLLVLSDATIVVEFFNRTTILIVTLSWVYARL